MLRNKTMTMRYADYLQVDALLALQRPLTAPAEHDELLFIQIHQVYELWFKQVLHEGDALVAHLHAQHVPNAMHTLKRMRAIFKTLVSQVDILETMTPLSFAAFRTRLEHASGFQSRQFREVECLFGAPLPHKIDMLAPRDQDILRERAERMSIFSAFIIMLKKSGLPITDDMIQKAQHSGTPNPDLHPALIAIYRENSSFAGVAEQLVDLDEGLQEWRYRHIKMVERTIGTKPGTGGSDGASYLKQTLFKPCFADLWAIRIHF